MITVTFTARDYKPEAVATRYARYCVATARFHWIECGPYDRRGRRFDIRQGTCAEGDLPPAVAAAAVERGPFFPSYVEWPR